MKVTVNELFSYGNERLKEAGIRDHKTDASLFLQHALNKDRTYILVHGDDPVEEKAEEVYRGYIEKRCLRIPLQQIVGFADFMGLEFYVNPSVLIPRFDTEFLVEEMMKYVDDGSRVLDMCTGTGCILLSLMCYKNDIEGVGADISEEALKVAVRNRDKLIYEEKLHGNAEFVKSDLFESIGGTFDHIASNPPYIRSEEIDGLEEEVKDHEPRTALDGGYDGLDFYRRIAAEAHKYLNREGRLFLEIGYDEGDEVRGIFEEKGYRDIRILTDYSGNERVMICLNR